jgi:hypothetical protein
MEQMKMDGLKVVPINYEDTQLPLPVRDLRPVVYMDGDAYFCLLGPDPLVGVFGCGRTKEKALADWTMHLHERISHPAETDELAQEILDLRRARKTDVW